MLVYKHVHRTDLPEGCDRKMLYITARNNERRRLAKNLILKMIETADDGMTLDLRYAAENELSIAASQLTRALGFHRSIAEPELEALGLQYAATRQLCASLSSLICKLRPAPVWGSIASRLNRENDRCTKLLTAMLSEMVDDRELYAWHNGPDLIEPTAGNQQWRYHYRIVTAEQNRRAEYRTTTP